jgi:hypothetical protein
MQISGLQTFAALRCAPACRPSAFIRDRRHDQLRKSRTVQHRFESSRRPRSMVDDMGDANAVCKDSGDGKSESRVRSRGRKG